MPKTQSNLKLLPRNLLDDSNNRYERVSRKKLSDLEQEREPLLFKQKIIRKLRQGYKSKLKQSVKQWRSKFKSFIRLKLQSYQENCTSSSQFICPICLQMYMTPCPTSCGHIFCFRCIDQSIIRNSNCPTCRNFIRTDQFIQSKAFSELNHHFWLSSKQKQEYLEKYQKNQQWLKARLIDRNSLQVNDLIDVKDTEHIWCKAKVLNIYVGVERTQILVHYESWNQIYNEVINVNSQRIAPRNFFSQRQDIPRYRLSSPQDNMRSRIEYRDYRDRNLNFNINFNPNENNNQNDSEEEDEGINNQDTSLRPNFRIQRNPLTIRLNTRQNRDSIFAIRSLIQPYILRNLRPQNQQQSLSQNLEEELESQSYELVESNQEHLQSQQIVQEQEQQSEQQQVENQSHQQQQQQQEQEQDYLVQQLQTPPQQPSHQQQLDQIQRRINWLIQRTDPQPQLRVRTQQIQYLSQHSSDQNAIQQIQQRNQFQNNLSVSNNSLRLIDDQQRNKYNQNVQAQNILDIQNQQVRSVSQYLNEDQYSNQHEIDRNKNQLRIEHGEKPNQQQQEDSQGGRIDIKQNKNQENYQDEKKLKKKKKIFRSQKTKSQQKRSQSTRAKLRCPKHPSSINLIQDQQQQNCQQSQDKS